MFKCSYMEIGYPRPCDFHDNFHEGNREDGEVIVRIVTDLPTKGGDRRYLTPLTKSFQSNLLTRINKKCLLEYMNAIVTLFLELHYRSFASKSINSIF